ncbi:hypothetical protein ABZ863_03765 [Saccharomonospora sp. NPDC046836]|uniref:hypothetical protein n=1 Tax=Saccharomonospora sp. NPDC046836 TaxID=3156921 RepID=UPI0033E3775D
MRRARVVVAVTALTAAGLTGCADRPNDLDTYYDDTVTTTTPESTLQDTLPESTADPSPAADAATLAAVVHGAVLTPEDVAAEGVSPAAPPAGMSGCLAQVPFGLVAPEHRAARWTYPTGSTLDQLVTAYPDRPAAEVLESRVRCDGEELGIVPEPAVAHAAWCADTTCTILLAKGHLLSGVQVAAADRERAAAAIQRLAPVAAATLTP